MNHTELTSALVIIKQKLFLCWSMMLCRCVLNLVTTWR